MRAEALDVGSVIDGKYRLEGVIGTGGMGVVFRARHLKLRERVAIKVLKHDRGTQPGLTERLLREARAAASIKSLRVVRVLDVGTLSDAQPFIVMEYLEGEDLAMLLSRVGPLPLTDAVDYLLQACEAVAEAHALGIVHRDLKPANLFLERRASGAVSIKVLDFGVARFLAGHTDADGSARGLTGSHSFVGSPAYVSPEQLTMPDDVDTRADVWALGVILYEMLSGVQPFKAGTLALTYTKILQDARPALSRADVPQELTRALDIALAKDRNLRQGVLELAAALAPHGSAAARASLTEIQSIARRGPLTPSEPATAKLGDPASPTLTGSVLRASSVAAASRVRRVALLLVSIGVVLAGLFLVASRRAAQPTAANGALKPASFAPPPPFSAAARPPDTAGNGSTLPASPPAIVAGNAAKASHSGARKAGDSASVSRPPSSSAPPSAADDSERLYEFRK